MNLRLPNLFKTIKQKLFQSKVKHEKETPIESDLIQKNKIHGGSQGYMKRYHKRTHSPKRKVHKTGLHIIHCFGTFSPCKKFNYGK